MELKSNPFWAWKSDTHSVRVEGGCVACGRGSAAKVEGGENFEASGQKFVDKWRKAERGKPGVGGGGEAGREGGELLKSLGSLGIFLCIYCLRSFFFFLYVEMESFK